MDPASIIGLVDASLNLAIKCASTLKRLNTIASQYKNARLTILSMVQNLDSLQLAWNRISVWSKSYVPDQDAAENGLIERLERFLETGALVMEALDEDLSTYDPDNLSLTDRSRLIWNGQGLQDHQNRLRDQATSMTLLLQAIQLPTIQETNEMLRNAQKQFQKSDESAYSIVPSRMSSRLSTSTRQSLSSDENMSYRRLSCENDLFTARVYKRSYRTPLIRRLFRRKVESDSDTATITGPEGALRSRSPDTEEYWVEDFPTLQRRPISTWQLRSAEQARRRAHSRERWIKAMPFLGEARRFNEASALVPESNKVVAVDDVERKVQIESDTATITRPERTFSSKSPDTQEHVIDSDKADHQMKKLDDIRIGDLADDMDARALRLLMERDRKYLERNEIK